MAEVCPPLPSAAVALLPILELIANFCVWRVLFISLAGITGRFIFPGPGLRIFSPGYFNV